MNPKRKGNITELSIALAFQQLDIPIAIPYGDCERYDLIADIKGKLYKIQCKTASPYRGDPDKISFDCRSTYRNATGTVNARYTEDQIDFFAAYYDGKCYLVPVNETSSEKILRFVPPANGQKVGVSMAKDYELEKVLDKL